MCGASFVLFHFFFLYSIEYIYPITTYIDNGQELVLFMHQTATQETRFWSLNMQTHSYEQLLSSRYNPIGVILLPDNSGFSFLDNGLIKVKKFLKRSPQTIEIYEPLYNFGIPQWSNNNHCFFHAKEGNRFGIYQTDLDGQVSPIIKNQSYDYLYPQKVDNQLFFIARDLTGNCYVKKLHDYATQNVEMQNIQDFGHCNVISLSMINENEGFVIEHMPTDDMQLTFNFYYFDIRGKKILFTFYLPSSFFIDKAIMLRDPLAALFPRITSDKIYFISCYKNQHNMQHYYYDLKINKIISCDAYNYIPVPNDSCSDNYQHILMSMITKNGLFSGFAWE